MCDSEPGDAHGGTDTPGRLYQPTMIRPKWPYEEWRGGLVVDATRKDTMKDKRHWYDEDGLRTILNKLDIVANRRNWSYVYTNWAKHFTFDLRPENYGHRDPTNQAISTQQPGFDTTTSETTATQIDFKRMLEKLSKPDNQTLHQKIIGNVTKLLEDATGHLRENDPAFFNCQLSLVGSMADGSKIGLPDEFDYIILLPLLGSSNIVLRFPYEGKFNTYQIVPMRDHTNLWEAVSGKQLAESVFEAVKRFPQPGWKTFYMKHARYASQMFLCFTTAEQVNIDVKLDISFAGPIDMEAIADMELNDLLDYCHIPLWNYLMNMLRENKGEMCALVQNDTPERYYEVSFARAETSLLQKADRGVVECYRLSKAIVSSLFPQIFSENSKTWQPFLPSYCLKNIVFYLNDFHEDQSAWLPCHLGKRMVEVFLLLQKCITSSSCASVIYLFWVEGCFMLPGYCSPRIVYKPSENVLRPVDGHDPVFKSEFRYEKLYGILEEFPLLVSQLQPYIDYMKTEKWRVLDALEGLNTILKGVFYYEGQPF